MRRVVLEGAIVSIFGTLFGGGTAAAKAGGDATRPIYPAHMTDPEIDAVFERARNELNAKTRAHSESWHQDGATWAVDLETGVITFKNERGWTITAPVQVIGTRSIADSSFLWAWDHPSIPPARTTDARLVKAFGDAQGLEALTTRKIEASKDEAWELTALAVHLAGANGAYRGPSNKAEAFMTFGEIAISK